MVFLDDEYVASPLNVMMPLNFPFFRSLILNIAFPFLSVFDEYVFPFSLRYNLFDFKIFFPDFNIAEYFLAFVFNLNFLDLAAIDVFFLVLVLGTISSFFGCIFQIRNQFGCL